MLPQLQPHGVHVLYHVEEVLKQELFPTAQLSRGHVIHSLAHHGALGRLLTVSTEMNAVKKPMWYTLEYVLQTRPVMAPHSVYSTSFVQNVSQTTSYKKVPNQRTINTARKEDKYRHSISLPESQDCSV